MSVGPNVEQRIAALERAVAELQKGAAGQEPTEPWWHRVVGSFADEPAFEEVLEFGRQFRASDEPPEDRGP